MRYTIASFFIVAALFLTACGGGSDTPPGIAEPTEPVEQTIVIRPVGNQMTYEQTEIEAKAGTRVRIVMDNTATSPAMQHNVVVLEADADPMAVGQTADPARDYRPSEGVIAATPMAAPRTQTEVYLTVPPPGEYPYICTFPGHYVSMQGVLRSVE